MNQKTQKTQAEERRRLIRRAREKVWLEEKQAEVLFLLAGGDFPKCSKTGVVLTKPDGKTPKETDWSIHHLIPLRERKNGKKQKRPNGKKKRVLSHARDLPVLLLLSAKEHAKIHEGESTHPMVEFQSGLLRGLMKKSFPNFSR